MKEQFHFHSSDLLCLYQTHPYPYWLEFNYSPFQCLNARNFKVLRPILMLRANYNSKQRYPEHYLGTNRGCRTHVPQVKIIPSSHRLLYINH